MSVEKILYRLNCQHVTLGTAFYVSGMLRCPFCHKDKPIVDVEVMEWRARCRNCKYARWCGMSEKTAEIFANGHARRYSTHSISVNRERHLAATKTKAKMDAWRVSQSRTVV